LVFIQLTPYRYPTSQLELRRTITSMTLTEEREILKQINKLQQQKLKSDEFQAYDGKIKDHRAMTNQLRDSLRQQTTLIQELRVEFNTMTTAADLGCHIKDLVGQKVGCPTEKIGPVIGKKGKNIKSIQTETNVSIDVQRKGDIHLIGTKESIGKAVSDINKMIERKEEVIELNETVKTFMTTAKITALTELRERHPDVYLNVGRDDSKTWKQ
jgi:exosome complex RNA-binding protein Rrp4